MLESNHRSSERGMELIPAPTVPQSFCQFAILVQEVLGE